MTTPVSRKRKSQEAHYDPQTPTRSPSKRQIRITQKQKQALIDNLQLEITDRARKLRAHYALQAQDLRARIERRINRIPLALRKQNLGELLIKYTETAKESRTESPFKRPVLPNKAAKTLRPITQASAPSNTNPAVKFRPGATRQSIDSSDKENAGYPDLSNHPLTNPKQRGKVNGQPNPTRTASQRTETNILSPKSSNSRTFPQSPLKTSPTKQQQQPYHIRAFSPLKHTSPTKNTNYPDITADAPRLRTTRGAPGVRRATPPGTSFDIGPARVPRPKKAASVKSAPASSRKATTRPTTRQTNRQVSSSTTASSASAATSGTTIVRSTRAAGARKMSISTISSTTSKKTNSSKARGAAATTSSTARKMTAAAARKAQAVEQPAPGRRVLRSRA